MTEVEAMQCMRLLNGYWPYANVPATALDVYEAGFRELEASSALEAVRRLPQRTKPNGERVTSFPSWPDVLSAYDQVRRERGLDMDPEAEELDAIRREWLALPYGGGSVWVRWAVQIVLWAWYSALLDTAFAVVRVEQAHVSDLPRERIEATRRQLETSGVLRRA